MNNDDFTVLVGGGGRCHWVSMYPDWLSHSKWLSGKSNKSASKWLSGKNNKSASNFMLNINIPPWKLFRWFRRAQRWATVIGSFITTRHLLMRHVLCRVFFAKHQITQVTQPHYGTDLEYYVFWLFPLQKNPEKEEISDHWWDSGKYNRAADGDWENCVRSQDGCLLWRGLRCHCPMDNVPCILYLLQ